MAKYKRGDIVLVPFPFITTRDIRRKLRPALVISDHKIKKRFDDLILLAITSQIHKPLVETEILLELHSSEFARTGLAVTSLIKCDMILTLPEDIVVKKLGELGTDLMKKVENTLRKGLGMTKET